VGHNPEGEKEEEQQQQQCHTAKIISTYHQPTDNLASYSANN